MEISEHLEPLGLSINKDALVLVPSENNSNVFEYPEISIMEGLEKILLVPSGKNNQLLHEKLDCETILKTIEEDEGIVFPIPWLVEREKAASSSDHMTSKQPCLVRNSPREIDLLIIDRENIVEV